jgi:flagellar biosynthetic protein FliQ
MEEAVFFDTMRQGLWIAVIISAPLLSVALVMGVVIGLFQALTSVQEMTLTFVPKLVAIFVTLVLAGPWMITLLTDFMRRLFESIPSMIG